MITRARLGSAAIGLIAIGALAATASSASNSASLPARAPTDARAADLNINTTAVPRDLLQTRTVRDYRIGSDGPRVRAGRSRTRGFTDFQTFVVFPPDGRDIYQGFATISGGNSGVFGILQTRIIRGRYVVNVSYPGDQGTPGRLTIRVQTLPEDG